MSRLSHHWRCRPEDTRLAPRRGRDGSNPGRFRVAPAGRMRRLPNSFACPSRALPRSITRSGAATGGLGSDASFAASCGSQPGRCRPLIRQRRASCYTSPMASRRRPIAHLSAPPAARRLRRWRMDLIIDDPRRAHPPDVPTVRKDIGLN